MIASPMYLSTVPPCLNTASVITVRYSRRNVTTSSGCIFSDMEVKPRMSEKSTVMRRRVAASLAVVLVPDDLGHHVRREEAREPPLLPLLLGEVLGHRARVGDEERQRHRHHLDPVAGPQEGGVAGREVGADRGRDDPEGGQGAERGGGPRGGRAREHRHHRHQPASGPGAAGCPAAGSRGCGRGSPRRACRTARRTGWGRCRAGSASSRPPGRSCPRRPRAAPRR